MKTGVSIASSASTQSAFKNLKISATGLANYAASVTADEVALENALNQYVTARSVSVTPTINTSGVNGMDNQAPQTCTISLANPAVITLNNHGFPANAPVVFATTGALPAHLTAGTTYYVVNPATNTFQVSASQGGAAISTAADTQSGTQTVASAYAASCWYSLWLMYNGATVSGKLSASATNPVLDAGYTFKARLGWVRTDGTANKYLLQTLQLGRRAQYVVLAASNTPNLPIMILGAQGSATTPTWVAVPTASYIPPTASQILGVLSSSTANVMAAPSNQYGAYNSTTNPPPVVLATASATVVNEAFWMTMESTNLYFASSGTYAVLAAMGWEDNI